MSFVSSVRSAASSAVSSVKSYFTPAPSAPPPTRVQVSAAQMPSGNVSSATVISGVQAAAASRPTVAPVVSVSSSPIVRSSSYLTGATSAPSYVSSGGGYVTPTPPSVSVASQPKSTPVSGASVQTSPFTGQSYTKLATTPTTPAPSAPSYTQQIVKESTSPQFASPKTKAEADVQKFASDIAASQAAYIAANPGTKITPLKYERLGLAPLTETQIVPLTEDQLSGKAPFTRQLTPQELSAFSLNIGLGGQAIAGKAAQQFESEKDFQIRQAAQQSPLISVEASAGSSTDKIISSVPGGFVISKDNLSKKVPEEYKTIDPLSIKARLPRTLTGLGKNEILLQPQEINLVNAQGETIGTAYGGTSVTTERSRFSRDVEDANIVVGQLSTKTPIAQKYFFEPTKEFIGEQPLTESSFFGKSKEFGRSTALGVVKNIEEKPFSLAAETLLTYPIGFGVKSLQLAKPQIAAFIAKISGKKIGTGAVTTTGQVLNYSLLAGGASYAAYQIGTAPTVTEAGQRTGDIITGLFATGIGFAGGAKTASYSAKKAMIASAKAKEAEFLNIRPQITKESIETTRLIREPIKVPSEVPGEQIIISKIKSGKQITDVGAYSAKVSTGGASQYDVSGGFSARTLAQDTGGLARTTGQGVFTIEKPGLPSVKQVKGNVEFQQIGTATEQGFKSVGTSISRIKGKKAIRRVFGVKAEKFADVEGFPRFVTKEFSASPVGRVRQLGGGVLKQNPLEISTKPGETFQYFSSRTGKADVGGKNIFLENPIPPKVEGEINIARKMMSPSGKPTPLKDMVQSPLPPTKAEELAKYIPQKYLNKAKAIINEATSHPIKMRNMEYQQKVKQQLTDLEYEATQAAMRNKARVESKQQIPTSEIPTAELSVGVKEIPKQQTPIPSENIPLSTPSGLVQPSLENLKVTGKVTTTAPPVVANVFRESIVSAVKKAEVSARTEQLRSSLSEGLIKIDQSKLQQAYPGLVQSQQTTVGNLQKQLQFQTPIISQALTVGQIQQQKIKQLAKQTQAQSQAQEQSQLQIPMLKQSQAQEQQQQQIQQQITVINTPLIPSIAVPFVPLPPEVPFILPPQIPGGGVASPLFQPPRFTRQKTRYTPSATAAFLGIKGKESKGQTATGVSFRPILSTARGKSEFMIPQAKSRSSGIRNSFGVQKKGKSEFNTKIKFGGKIGITKNNKNKFSEFKL